MNGEPPDNMLLRDVEMSARLRGCLERAGLRTVGQVRGMTDGELRREPNLGRLSVKEARQLFGEYRRPYYSPQTEALLQDILHELREIRLRLDEL